MLRQTFDRVRRRVQHGFPQDGYLRDLERQVSGKHFVGHHGQRVLIGRGSLRLAVPLFRGHVRGGASGSLRDHAHTRHARVDLGREAEVEDLHIPLGIDHDVARLDVAVDDLLFVGVVERGCHLTDDRKDIVQRQGIFPAHPSDPSPKVFPLDAFHDEVVIAGRMILFQLPVDRDVLMHELGNKLEVLLHVFHFQLAEGQLRRKGLQRDDDPRRFVETFVDDAHAALAEL